MIQKHITIFLILLTALALPQFARADIKTLEVDNSNFNNVIEDKGLCFDSVLLYNKPSLLQHHGT